MKRHIDPYAFNRPGERVERLKDHIIKGLEAIREYYIKEGYQVYVVHRLKALSLDVEPTMIEGALLFSYIYHDIAKAAEPYQTRIIRNRSASGHDIVSAFIAMLALEEGPFWLPEPLGWACVKAIAFHMVGLRELVEKAVIMAGNILKQHDLDAFTMSEEVVLWFNKLVESSWQIPEIPPPTLQARELTILWEDLRLFISRLSPRLRGSSDFNAEDLATMLILHPLVVADEVAVATNIGREVKPWARDFIDSIGEARKYRRGDT